MEDITMKKAYIKPQLNVFEIESSNLCAVSDNSANIYGTQKGASGALSREGGLVWELEEVSEEE